MEVQVLNPPEARPLTESLCATLRDLIREQLALDPSDSYLAEHARPEDVLHRVRTFRWYSAFLPPGGDALDWGCLHAPDSCLLRARFGDSFRLHGCDVVEPARYEHCHRHAGLAYEQLTDLVGLPYPDDSFDVVVGSGTLEHVPMDYESLKEVYRVLRPGGKLVLTYLPNRLSREEFVKRVLRRRGFHRRPYGRAEVVRLLRHAGLYPLHAGYREAFFENRLLALGLDVRFPEGPLARLLGRLLPAN
jgi:SAM-dependent methyltransferase